MGGLAVHRLGTALCLAVAVLGTASAVAAHLRARAASRRIAALLPAGARRRRPAVLGARIRVLAAQWWGPAGVLLAVWVLVGGAPGAAAGCAAASGMWWLRRRMPGRRPDGAEAEEAERQLPFAADLLAACLAAGAGPVEAAEAVGESLGGPVGERLALAGAEVRLGGEPGAAWGRLARIPGAGALAACLERAARTGAPAAEPVARLAKALREERSRQATARAQRAAVLVTAPVGLCFLPAFLAVGVAPVVIGMASGLLSGT
ncbi:type II secretion system F family protein [Streptomyces sp. NPDC090445]|uniref:type II secretion system F family protein n=1 Tax=Streptomyces sp. NPDC090445 TaxID=3365963 RepID=UPI00381A25B6